MAKRNVVCLSGMMIGAVLALSGCNGDDTSGANNPFTGAGTGSGGTGAPSAVTGGTGAQPMAGASMASGGVGGAATGGTGAMMATGGSAPAGTGGMGSPMAGGDGGMMMATGGTGDTGGTDAATGGSGGVAAGSCGPEGTVSAADLGDPSKRGPWMPTMEARSGPRGSSTLFYPMDLGKDGVLHPVFHWGCGAGSQPSQYADHLSQLASYGFVVIANASGSMPAKSSLDWLLAENDKADSKFYQKLDPERVGMGGHSLGALETFQGASDPRVNLYVLVCGGSGSGTTGAANIHGPSIFLGGEGEGGTVNFEADYNAITMAPSVFVTKTSTDHIYCARNNLGPWVAFMRWQMCGEDKWAKEFMPDGTYCKSPWLACKSKGF